MDKILTDIEIVENNDDLKEFYIENEKTEIYNNLIKSSEKTYRITKFEKAKIIGIRGTQLESGIETLLDDLSMKTLNTNNVLNIAELEFKKGLIPIIIKRKLANEKKIYIQFNNNNFSNLDTI